MNVLRKIFAFWSSLARSSLPAAKVKPSTLASEKDTELVRRCRDGDTGAFDEIVECYSARVFSVALHLLRDRGDAEAIVHETFQRVHRGLPTFSGESLATWIQAIATNLSRNQYWYSQRRQLRGRSDTFSDLVASDAATAPKETVVKEFAELVTVCMAKLEGPEQEILTMRTVLNQSYDEIAAALGISEGAVKNRISRARGLLREQMAESHPEFRTGALPAEWFEPAQTA